MSRLSHLGGDALRLSAALIAVAFAHLIVVKTTLPALAAGLAAIFAIAIIGYAFARLAPVGLPDLFWVSLVAIAATAPGVPGASVLTGALDELDLASTMVPVMAFAALGLRKDETELFRRTGPAFVVISLLVFTGVFIGCALIAHIILALTG